ncbi:hypothetical protein ACVIGA_002621 [Bradyrhizobium sp. USDA 3240]
MRIMTRYFFDYRPSDSEAAIDETGHELESLEAARAMAFAALGDAAFDEGRDGHEFRLTIDIRDGSEVVGTATVTISTT